MCVLPQNVALIFAVGMRVSSELKYSKNEAKLAKIK